jgi:exodeoxyribonuclease VII small subunit
MAGRIKIAAYNGAMPEDKTLSRSFEASLEELERIVKELEKGDLPLEQSLALFENGMRLSAECKRQLEDAESRVEILMKRGAEVVAVPFQPEKTGK